MIQQEKRSEHYFTIIELLVVIAIIAVLASMLLPALNNARRTAMSISCVSRLKQLGQQHLSYSDEYNGYLPYLCNETTGIWWTDAMLQYSYPDAKLTTNTDNVFLYKGIENSEAYRKGQNSIYSCPEAVKYYRNIHTPTYGRNKQIYMPGQTSWYGSPVIAKCRKPSTTVLAGDAYIKRNAGWDIGQPYIQNSLSNIGTVHFRNMCNVVWIDGHVSGDKALNLVNNSEIWTLNN